MRVLHINGGNLYGGVETLLITLARLRELTPDVEPEFALCFEGRLAAELKAIGAQVHFLGETRVRNPLSVLNARRKLGDVIRSGNFDAAICHMAWAHAIFGPVVRAFGVPLVVWQHMASDGRHWLERWSRMTRPDLTISNSKFTAACIPDALRASRSMVIYCPVAPPRAYDQAERMTVRDECETALDALVIIHASRMQDWKGHTLLLKAARELREVGGWCIWIVGGPQREFEARYFEGLRAMTSEYGIADRVRFLGERTDVARLMAASDIHCQPNLTPEPFGIGFIEALYAGLPVITTAIGAAPEIVSDGCGVMVSPGDVTGLAVQIRRLISDEALRKRMGACGPGRAHELCAPELKMVELRAALDGIGGVESVRSAPA